MSKLDGISNTTKLPYWKKRRLERRDEVRRIEKNSYYKIKYGITLDEFDDLLMEQCYLCKICGLILRSDIVKNICVDHDHKTGEIRGILCGKCNKALGLVNDNVDILKEMIIYLGLKT